MNPRTTAPRTMWTAPNLRRATRPGRRGGRGGRAMAAVLSLAFPLSLWLAATGVPARAAAPPAPVAVGQVLPDLRMDGLNGPARGLASYRGRPLIINLWASWCGPCQAEAASLERFAWSEAGRRYTVIGISTDDDRRAALQWLRRSNATLTHYIDANQALENLLGASHIPLTVLVDAQGRVVTNVRGAREWDSAESARLVEQAYRSFKPPAQPAAPPTPR